MTDYGHAMSVVQGLREKDRINKELEAEGKEPVYPEDSAEQAEKERQRILAADWECRRCGAVSDTAKKSVCKHSATLYYDMVE